MEENYGGQCRFGASSQMADNATVCKVKLLGTGTGSDGLSCNTCHGEYVRSGPAQPRHNQDEGRLATVLAAPGLSFRNKNQGMGTHPHSRKMMNYVREGWNPGGASHTASYVISETLPLQGCLTH